MSEPEFWTQKQLSEHWQISTHTLERWRSEGIGSIFLKMQGQVRYRLSDILAFEQEALRKSTSEPYVAGGKQR